MWRSKRIYPTSERRNTLTETPVIEKIDPKSVIVRKPESKIDGVKPIVAQKIERSLKQGRRYFGSSGGYMTHQAFNPEYTEKEGSQKIAAKEFLDGERATTTFLKKWVEDKPSAVIIESVKVPDVEDEELDQVTGIIEGQDVDHIVIIGDEIILIDTKRWKKKKNYGVADNGSALMTNKTFPGNKIHMSEYIQNWLDYLDEDACITGIVCINQEEVSVTRNKNWYVNNYRLVELDRFEELLNQKWQEIEESDKKSINTTLVSQLVVRCVKPYDEYSKVFDMNSLREFK